MQDTAVASSPLVGTPVLRAPGWFSVIEPHSRPRSQAFSGPHETPLDRKCWLPKSGQLLPNSSSIFSWALTEGCVKHV